MLDSEGTAGMILVVLPFCEKDHGSLIRMIQWMKELGGCKDHTCAIAFDSRTSPEKVNSAIGAAQECFAECRKFPVVIPAPDNRWPNAANILFEASAKIIQEHFPSPWLWMEPDCVPIVKGWLDYLERDYARAGKPFMGSRLDPVSRKVTGLAGIAVYPSDAYSRMKPVLINRAVPFDMAIGEIAARDGFLSPLMLHWWGSKNTPPTFQRQRGPKNQPHIKTLDFIPKTCVLFHRCKDGSLIDLLKQTSMEVNHGDELTVVITSHQRPKHLLEAFKSCVRAGIRNMVVTSTGDWNLMRQAFDTIEKESKGVCYLDNKNSTSNQSWLHGVESAQTKYVTILHDDDLLLPDYLKLVSPGIAADAPFIMVQARNHGVPDYIEKDSSTNGLESSSVLKPRLNRKGGLAISPLRGVFLKSDLVQWLRECEDMPKECYLRPGFLVGNDLTIWLKATEKYPSFYNIPHPAVSFGHWEGSTTVAELDKGDGKLAAIYDKARKWNSTKKPMSIHILTMVLDGMPFIKRHLDVFSKLTIPWEWHIVEGAASNTHCTKWCKPQQGRMSQDGTTEYLNQISSNPHVHIYGKPLWDGKIEMVNAPLKNIKEECVLLEVDCDEYWTAEQLESMVELFKSDQTKSHAMFWCRYFFGPHLVMEDRNCYGNAPSQDWKRAWRFKPGDKFLRHEPPILSSESSPFMHNITEAAGLVFDHHGYVQRSQVEFKERFYGYKDAVKHWERLQHVSKGSVKLSDYLPWVHPGNSGRVKVIK